jgi:hypothetical protein
MVIVVFSSWVKVIENLVLGGEKYASKSVIKSPFQNTQNYGILMGYQHQQMDNIIIVYIS